MQVSFVLDGKRGAKYRLIASQIGADVGGGVLWEVQHYRSTRRNGGQWVSVASTREGTNDPASRILAAWLTTPSVKDRETGDLGSLSGHHHGTFKEGK